MNATTKKQTKLNEKVEAAEEGLTTEELLGLRTIQVKRTASKLTRIAGSEERLPQITGIIVEEDHPLEGESFKWGLVTQEVLNKVLATGKRKGDDIILFLPDPDPESPINWVNYL
ncbi:MAG: hypothetical protein ACFFG0_09715 [Candidatus Thorarchaeota archaeon]